MREEILPGGMRYRYDELVFPLSTDSLLLASFAKPKHNDTVADLGAGAGLLELLLAAGDESLRFLPVELDAHAAELAQMNFAENNLASRVRLFCGDLRQRKNLPASNAVDYLVSNPPYYPCGSGAVSGQIPSARSEECCSLADIAAAARYLLRSGGRLALVHRAERLADVCCLLRESGLEPKRLRLVQHSPDSAPSLLLIEAVNDGRPGLTLEPVLLLHKEAPLIGKHKKETLI